jgi:hypothetical protein
MGEKHVHNVICPSCKIEWTGAFEMDDRREEVLCQDCIRAEIAVRQARTE